MAGCEGLDGLGRCSRTEGAVESCTRDSESSGHLRCRESARAQYDSLFHLSVVEQAFASDVTATRPRGFSCCRRSLIDQRPLVLRKCREDGCDHAPNSRIEVHALPERAQEDPTRLQVVNGCDDVAQRPPETVERNHGDGVTVARVVEECVQPRPLGSSTGHDIFEDSLYGCRL